MLAGHIIDVVAYRDASAARGRLAVLRMPWKSHGQCAVYLLEQVGGTYRQLWESELQYTYASLAALQVADLDGDGVNELAWMTEDGGTHAGYRVLNVYSPRSTRVAKVTEYSERATASAPPSPPPSFEPDDDPASLRLLERWAPRFGFLDLRAADHAPIWDAVQRWHEANGDSTEGALSLARFTGDEPPQGPRAGVMDTLDVGGIVWTAYFHGPLDGWVKGTDQHFVAYSRDYTYESVTRLAYDGEVLWFGVFGDEGALYSLRLRPDDANVRRYVVPEMGMELDSLRCDRDARTLIINEVLTLRLPSKPGEAPRVQVA